MTPVISSASSLFFAFLFAFLFTPSGVSITDPASPGQIPLNSKIALAVVCGVSLVHLGVVLFQITRFGRRRTGEVSIELQSPTSTSPQTVGENSSIIHSVA